MSQPSGPQRLALPAGGHGGPAVHVAPGEGGADGRGGGPQRPPCGAARRGVSLIALIFMLKTNFIIYTTRLPFYFYSQPYTVHFRFLWAVTLLLTGAYLIHRFLGIK